MTPALDHCPGCRKLKPCLFAGTAKARCHECSKKKEDCSRCGRNRIVGTRTPSGEALCKSCGRKTEPCTGCGRERTVVRRIESKPFCDYCHRFNPATFRPCKRCNTAARLVRGLCTPCTAAETIAGLFTDRLLRDFPEILPIHEACLAADPIRIVRTFQRAGSVELLRTLLTQREARTHEFLDKAGTDQATRAVRSILVEHGLLPPRDNHLANFQRWIFDAAKLIESSTERRVFAQFSRWRHVRELRQRPKPLSTSLVSSRRRELRIVLELLEWSAQRGRSLVTLDQADLDAWLATGHGERHRVKAFLSWAHRNGACRKLRFPPRPRGGLNVTGLDTAIRLKLLEDLLAGESPVNPRVAFAACMVLLYGARPHQLARLQLKDIVTVADETYVQLGPVPLLLPERVGALARATMNDRSALRLFTPVTDERWLFPGSRPGQHLTSAALIKQLWTIGVPPGSARTSALGGLAQDLPPAILARLTGISVGTAIRWTESVSASNARYASVALARPATEPYPHSAE